MQPRTSTLLAVFGALAVCEHAAASTFLGHIEASGKAGAAVRGPEPEAEEELADGRALRATAGQEQSGAEGAQREAALERQDANAIKRAAQLEYNRHIAQAKKELKDSPADEKAAEGAAVVQERSELDDAAQLLNTADKLHQDAAGAAAEAAAALGDAQAINKVATMALVAKRRDVQQTEQAAKGEWRPLVEAARTAQDAASLAVTSKREADEATVEDREAAMERQDAKAIERAAQAEHASRVARARRELWGNAADERAAEEAARLERDDELADAKTLVEAAGKLGGDAKATFEEAAVEDGDSQALARAAALDMGLARRPAVLAKKTPQQRRASLLEDMRFDAAALREVGDAEAARAGAEEAEAGQEEGDAKALDEVAKEEGQHNGKQAQKAALLLRNSSNSSDAQYLREAAIALREDARGVRLEAADADGDAKALAKAVEIAAR